MLAVYVGKHGYIQAQLLTGSNIHVTRVCRQTATFKLSYWQKLTFMLPVFAGKHGYIQAPILTGLAFMLAN
jgi:hypothetical protein